MGRQKISVRICDRCPNEKPAVDSIQICFEGVTYLLDLCAKHAEMMQRDVFGWIRLGREADKPHGPAKTWTPGAQFRSQHKVVPPPPPKIVINHDEGTEEVVQETPKPKPPPTVPDEDEQLYMTYSARTSMQEHDLSWEQVIAAVDNAWAIYPSPSREDVHCYLSDSWSVLVADDGAVLGVAVREAVEPEVRTQQPVKKIERRGKRGGQGRLLPTSVDELIADIRAHGWQVDDKRRHYAVFGPEGQRSTLPKTASDHRSVANAVTELRRLGLDLRRAVG